MFKKKRVAIVVIMLIFCIFVTSIGVYYWSSDNDDYQMLLNTEPSRQPENVGKTIYEVKSSKEYGWVDPSLQQSLDALNNGVANGNFSASEKQVLDALEKLLGKSYSKAWVKSQLHAGGQKELDWVYKIFPYSVVMYIQYGILSSVQIAQTAEECGWGTSSLYRACYNTGGMSNPWTAWKYASGRGPNRPEGGYYAAFKNWQDALHSEVYKEAHDYHATRASDFEGQTRKIAQGGWCADKHGGADYYKRLSVYLRIYHLSNFDKYAQQVKNVLANVSGSVAGNEATGKPGEWQPTGSASAMQKAGVKINSLTKDQGAVLSEAFKYMGLPYVWGGTTPKPGFDCSGFTQWVYKHALGIAIGRNTYAQINAGVEVSRKNLQPGDLVFPSPHHVTIYIGNGKVIHSPQTGDHIKVSPIWAFWRARRIIGHG